MAKVSVIIPHYNHHAFLWTALKSLALQTVQPYEVIVVDDGSNDPIDTHEVRHFFEPPRPEVTLVNRYHAGTGPGRRGSDGVA